MNCKPNCHHHRLFRCGRVLGRQAEPFLRGGRRPAPPDRRGFAQELIDYTDKIYLEFGADPHVEGVSERKTSRKSASAPSRPGLQLVDCPIRHLGTEKAQELYLAIQNYLADNGVEMRFGYRVRATSF